MGQRRNLLGRDRPHIVSAGLRRRIDDVLSQRSHGAAEVCGAVRDWFVELEVDAPDVPPEDPPPPERRWPA